MTDDLWRLDASELARLIRLGRVSRWEATESYLARVDAVNLAINAVVRVLAEEALVAADAADEARAQGDTLSPLHGVPVTTKVNTDQVGYPTDNGVVAYRDMIASEDSPVVANLKRAGAVIVGRTNTPAFSMRLFAPEPARPGAAVATGIGPIAHGNDIGGSIRIPALFNGVVGLRISLGRIPSYNPSQPVARPIRVQLMAVQGPLVRSVRDARLALAAMAQGASVDTRWVDAPLAGPPPRSIHVALMAQNPGGFTHPAQVAAVQQAGRHLAAAGYVVDEVMLPDPVSKIGHTAAVYLFDDRGRVRQIVGQMALASADIPAIAADLEPLVHRASG